MKKTPHKPKHKISSLSVALKVLNGCGGNKGTKCGVEVYYMPEDSKPNLITN